MINLAGHKQATEIVTEELFAVGIPAVTVNPGASEVMSTVGGALDGLSLRRAWTYWVVEGHVPLNIARVLYEQQPYGRRDVRVAGHCGCPPPEDPWLTYWTAAGVEVWLPGPHDEEMLAKNAAGTLSPMMAAIVRQLLATRNLVHSKEERDRVASLVTVDGYHIDSLAGLRLFADTWRELGGSAR